MPVNESVFALFFAIFWGGVLNVSGRWRMFQPLFCFGRTLGRFWLSFLFMVILPICYFALQLQCVGTGAKASTGVLAAFAAVLPALGIFAFYRIWMAIVEKWPRRFYWSAEEYPPDYRLREIDPSIESLTLGNGLTGKGNVWAAVIYGVFAVLVPGLIR